MHTHIYARARITFLCNIKEPLAFVPPKKKTRAREPLSLAGNKGNANARESLFTYKVFEKKGESIYARGRFLAPLMHYYTFAGRKTGGFEFLRFGLDSRESSADAHRAVCLLRPSRGGRCGFYCKHDFLTLLPPRYYLYVF